MNEILKNFLIKQSLNRLKADLLLEKSNLSIEDQIHLLCKNKVVDINRYKYLKSKLNGK